MERHNTTKGRKHSENQTLQISDPFLEDYTRILHSSPLRRLQDKTQVFTRPEDSLVRNRLTHTNEVVGVAIKLSEHLGLNTSLCAAIALGHDLGHTPYGHLGEEFISEKLGHGFSHAVGSSIIAGLHYSGLTRKGGGLNLSFETLQGVLHHSKSVGNKELEIDPDLPEEYAIVMFADKFAYTTSDINDLIRYNYLDGNDLPKEILALGKNQAERIETLMSALIEESGRKGIVSFSEGEVYENFKKARGIMYNIYVGQDHSVKREILTRAYDFFSTDEYFVGISPEVCIWLLTDKEANYLGTKMIESGGRLRIDDFKEIGIYSFAKFLKGKKIDLSDPGLEWAKGREDTPIKSTF